MIAMTTSSSIKVNPVRFAATPATAQGTTSDLPTGGQFEEFIGNSACNPFRQQLSLTNDHAHTGPANCRSKRLPTRQINMVDGARYNGPF